MGRRFIVAAVASIAACGVGAASAQTVETMKVGALTKNAYGTVTGLQAGDIACYMTLKDDRGQPFKEMADFELCDQKAKLLNKRVALKYTLQKVASPECQGDPACKKSTTVALVTAATPAAGTAALPSPARFASFCTMQEQIVFSCSTGQKQVSVCSDKGSTATKGTLYYRFGDPRADTFEIELPKESALPPKAANGATEAFSGGGGAWLMFRQGQVTYSVYTGIGNWGPKGEKREKAGLLVQRGGKDIAVLKCMGKYSSELGPELFERLGIEAGKIDFDFPD